MSKAIFLIFLTFNIYCKQIRNFSDDVEGNGINILVKEYETANTEISKISS